MLIFNTRKIITKNIKKDYPNEKVISDTYTNLERILMENLKKNSNINLKEMRYEIDMRLQHIEITDFDKFIGIRLGYYAVTLAIIAIILSSQELVTKFNLNTQNFIYLIIFFMIIVIVSHNIVTIKQREELIYCRFKLKCIDEIIDKKSNKKVKQESF